MSMHLRLGLLNEHGALFSDCLALSPPHSGLQTHRLNWYLAAALVAVLADPKANDFDAVTQTGELRETSLKSLVRS